MAPTQTQALFSWKSFKIYTQKNCSCKFDPPKISGVAFNEPCNSNFDISWLTQTFGKKKLNQTYHWKPIPVTGKVQKMAMPKTKSKFESTDPNLRGWKIQSESFCVIGVRLLLYIYLYFHVCIFIIFYIYINVVYIYRFNCIYVCICIYIHVYTFISMLIFISKEILST